MAVLLSLLLHAALLTAISVFGDLRPLPRGDYGAMRITVTPAPRSPAAVVDTDTVPAPANGDLADETPLQETGSEEPTVADSPAEPEPVESIEPVAPQEAMRTADNTTPAEERTAEATEEIAELEEVIVAAERYPEPEHEPESSEPEQTKPIRKASIAESEGERIARRIERWATDFTDLAALESDTIWKNRGNEYTATVKRIAPADNMGIEQAVVTITTERDGQQLSTQMHMQRLGFSHFAQFIDHWDPNVQIHDDIIDGRFHSNSEIFIARSGGVQPQFTGKVTAARGINTSNSRQGVRRSEVFLGGVDMRAPRISLPRELTLFDSDSGIDAQHIYRFDTDTRIIFASDGSFSWNTVEGSRRRTARNATELQGGNGHISDGPHYFVAANDAALHVRGTINGQILVYSPRRIVIEGSLVYANDPRSEPSSDDFLGLVSERFVEVAEQSITGPGDLHVHAAIYARSRFIVRNYGKRDEATLFVFGSVASGSMSATEPRYSTKINFDTRLTETRPPQFPVTNRYEITSWDRNWSVVED